MAFQFGAFQAAFQVIPPDPGTAGGVGRRGYGRLAHTGETYYPFGKPEARQLALLAKKKKKLEDEVRALERELRRKEREAKALETSKALEYVQGLKQQLLLLWEQIAALEAELSWLRELRENAAEAEINEVMEVYMIARLH